LCWGNQLCWSNQLADSFAERNRPLDRHIPRAYKRDIGCRAVRQTVNFPVRIYSAG
jgi:hypothetical protein